MQSLLRCAVVALVLAGTGVGVARADTVDTLFETGTRLRAAGDCDRALGYFRRVLARRPPPAQRRAAAREIAACHAEHAAGERDGSIASVARPRTVTRDRWYGWQILLADLGAFGIAAAGVASESEEMVTLGGVAFVLASPVIHMAHERPGPSLAWGFLRVAMPGVGLALGAREGSREDIGPALGGALLGAALASILDQGFARDDTVVVVAPAEHDGVTIAVSGAF